jgi:hypothetical protein
VSEESTTKNGQRRVYPPDKRVSLDGSNLLDEVVRFLRRYVVLSDKQADLIALWIVHTHAFDVAETTPYLEIVSAEKRSGKTRLLEVLANVAPRPWLAGRVTSAVLARKIQAEQPTLLLDETDAAFKGDKEYAETLRGILNVGFRRGGAVSLCIGQGANLSYADFTVFSPKAIAGLGKLPDTIADRSVRIELKRRTRAEPVERFRLREVMEEARPLRESLERWSQEQLEGLRGLYPDLPEELDDRAQDIVEPLMAIAERVGGSWPRRARRAVIALAGANSREDAESLGVRLLRDTRTVFDEQEVERLRTTTLLTELNKRDDAPWGSLRGEALDARGLARLLRPYGIGPKPLRLHDDVHKGYEREDFEDAWKRYIPQPPDGDPPDGDRARVTDRDGSVTDSVTGISLYLSQCNRVTGYAGGTEENAHAADKTKEAQEQPAPTLHPKGYIVTHYSDAAHRAENHVTDRVTDAETVTVTAEGGTDSRHSQERLESEHAAPSGRRGSEEKGKGEVGETSPDHHSPSPASDAPASQTALEIAEAENDALSGGSRLIESQQEVFDLLREWKEHNGRKGL